MPDAPVPDCYNTYQVWMRDLERLRGSQSLYQGGNRAQAADSSRAYIRELTQRRLEVSGRRDAAQAEALRQGDSGRACSKRYLDAVHNDPQQRGAGTIQLRTAYQKATADRDAAWGAYEAAHAQYDAIGRDIELAERAQNLQNVQQGIQQKIQQIRDLAVEARRSHNALIDLSNKTYDRVRQHKTALAELSGPRKNQLRVFTTQESRNAAERVAIASNDLVKHRLIEFGINVFSFVAGVAKAVFDKVFTKLGTMILWGIMQGIQDRAISLVPLYGIGIHDAFYQRAVIWPRDIEAYWKKPELERMLRTKAKAKANDFHIGGFTELGAKLVGNQYSVLEDALYTMLKNDLKWAVWQMAEDHEKAAVKEGEKLLVLLDKRIEEYRPMVGEIENGAASLGR
jgi:hypothetical protein